MFLFWHAMPRFYQAVATCRPRTVRDPLEGGPACTNWRVVSNNRVQKAWATLSSFWCHLLISQTTRQSFRPRNVVPAIVEFSEQSHSKGLGNIIILLMPASYCSENSTKFQTTQRGPSDCRVVWTIRRWHQKDDNVAQARGDGIKKMIMLPKPFECYCSRQLANISDYVTWS